MQIAFSNDNLNFPRNSIILLISAQEGESKQIGILNKDKEHVRWWLISKWWPWILKRGERERERHNTEEGGKRKPQEKSINTEMFIIQRIIGHHGNQQSTYNLWKKGWLVNTKPLKKTQVYISPVPSQTMPK